MKIRILILSLLLSACASHQTRKPSSSEPPLDAASQKIQTLAQSEAVKAAVLEFANSVTNNGSEPPFWQLVTHDGSTEALSKRLEEAERILAKESNTELRAFLQKLESLGFSVLPNHPTKVEPWQVVVVNFSYTNRSLFINIRASYYVSLIYNLPVSDRGYTSADDIQVTNYSGKKNQF